MGHGIHRMGGHQQDRIPGAVQYGRDHIPEYPRIAFQQLRTRLSRLLPHSRRYHHHRSPSQIGVFTGGHFNPVRKWHGMGYVGRLGPRASLIGIHQHDRLPHPRITIAYAAVDPTNPHPTIPIFMDASGRKRLSLLLKYTIPGLFSQKPESAGTG